MLAHVVLMDAFAPACWAQCPIVRIEHQFESPPALPPKALGTQACRLAGVVQDIAAGRAEGLRSLFHRKVLRHVIDDALCAAIPTVAWGSDRSTIHSDAVSPAIRRLRSRCAPVASV